MRLTSIFLLILFLIGCREKNNPSLFEDIYSKGSEQFQKVLDEKDKYEIQILYSPIQRSGDSIIIKDHFFNFRPGEYFYPASTVKMPVAFMALQKLERLRNSGIAVNRDTPIRIDSIRPPQSSAVIDTTLEGSRPTIGHYIEKVFANSDNDAYNRLYEFCGSDYINAGLRAKGIFTNSRIIHRVGVGGFSYEENKHAPPFHFLDSTDRIIYTQEASYAQGNNLTIVDQTQKGIAHINGKDLVNEPFDFSKKNFININDLQETLKRVVFPQLYFEGETYSMSEEDRAFVIQTMGKLPRHYPYLEGQLDEFYDSYVKFFLFGDSKEPMPEHIIIRNKVGFAYGYLTDCAYIHDTKEDVEYFLTATIHVNDNQTYNDGVYEYDDVGIPFLAELGRLIHAYSIENK